MQFKCLSSHMISILSCIFRLWDLLVIQTFDIYTNRDLLGESLTFLQKTFSRACSGVWLVKSVCIILKKKKMFGRWCIRWVAFQSSIKTVMKQMFLLKFCIILLDSKTRELHDRDNRDKTVSFQRSICWQAKKNKRFYHTT